MCVAVLVIFFDMEEIGGVRFGVECGLLLRKCFAVRPFTSVASLEYGLEGDRERERELKRVRT